MVSQIFHRQMAREFTIILYTSNNSHMELPNCCNKLFVQSHFAIIPQSFND